MGKLRIIEMIDKPSLGGGQRAVLLLARGLDRELFDVRVASGGDGPLVDQTQRAGLAHIPFGPGPRFSLKLVAEIARILEADRTDILHTHGGYAGLHGRWAARRSRTPVVVHTLHGIHYLHYRNPALRRLSIWQERLLSRTTDALVLVCQSDLGLARRHRLAPPEKLVVIQNGVETAPAAAPGSDPAGESDRPGLRVELGWEPGRPIVGTVARLQRQKGIIHLLRAAPTILAAFPEARIAVVGDGPLGGDLRRRAGRMGLDGRVLFLGERDDARRIMSLFDVFVLPSLWEGLPFVLVEAAALGKPIVATAVDGVPEIVDDGKTGALVRPADPGALAEAVIRLLKDKAAAGSLAETARSLIPPRFPLRRTVEQHQDLYLRIFNEKSSADSR
jgi:glycosyltransferase involved in cell wall biosynthesis